jgi:ribonuclease Z
MPAPEPTASGPAAAVVRGDRVLLFDAGAGVMRMSAAAKLPRMGPEAAFFTHLHSDHTLGYADLILTPWIMGRRTRLPAFGPPGLRAMTEHLLAAFGEDIGIRTAGLEGLERGLVDVDVREIGPGLVYEKEGVRVTAFPVVHGGWKHAFGYRVDTADRSVVISGDTMPCPGLVEAARGCDVLVHEVYSQARLAPEKRPGGEDWPAYMAASHTSDVQLGRIAAEVQPGLLVMTHVIRMGATDDELLAGVRQGGFNGRARVGHDLEVF